MGPRNLSHGKKASNNASKAKTPSTPIKHLRKICLYAEPALLHRAKADLYVGFKIPSTEVDSVLFKKL